MEVMIPNKVARFYGPQCMYFVTRALNETPPI